MPIQGTTLLIAKKAHSEFCVDAISPASLAKNLIGRRICRIGIGFGGGVVCIATVLSNYYGTKVFASLIGLSLAVNTTFGALVPYVAGRLYDSGYGYQGVFYTLAIWCDVGAIVLFFMKIPIKGIGMEQAS